MRFLLKRLLESLIVIWVVATLAFFALRLGHVDPLATLLSQGLATQAQAQALRESLGLDRPLATQYTDFIGGVLHGDFGRSIFSGQAVTTMTAEAMGYTVPLAVLAWCLSMLAGLALGALASHRGETGRRGKISSFFGSVIAVGASTPVAWSGILLLWISLPVVSLFTAEPVRDAIRLLLPVLALTGTVGCSIGRAAEASIRQAQGEPFFLAMRAHGFPSGFRADWRLLRAAVAPVLALAGLEAAFLLGGTMVTEVVFARPGLGRLLVDSILRGDYAVVQAVLPLVALGYSFFGILADLTAAALDPRMREVK